VADGEVAIHAGVGPSQVALDGDRFNPVNDVLEPEMGTDGLRDVQGRPRVARLGADVQEQRAFGPQDP
jgi:hypothetical protein